MILSLQMRLVALAPFAIILADADTAAAAAAHRLAYYVLAVGVNAGFLQGEGSKETSFLRLFNSTDFVR